MRRLVASWFGTGLLLRRLRGADEGSGTVAAVVTFPFALALSTLGWQAQAAGVVVVAGASLWSSDRFGAEHGDPPWVVVDEAAGLMLAVIGLRPLPAVVALVVFRVADIAKGWFPGVGAAESLPGGWGITADDLVAGLYGLAAGWAVQTWLL